MKKIIEQFWAELKSEFQKDFFTKPEHRERKLTYKMLTKKDFIFDDAFWVIFHKYPFYICHVSTEDHATTDKHSRVLELIFGIQQHEINLYNALAKLHPSLARNQVWCKKCGKTRKINTAHCLHYGFPECCNETMTIDSPAEQKKFKEE